MLKLSSVLVALVAFAVACVEGTVGGPMTVDYGLCATVDCGNGTCWESDNEARCECDQGFQADGLTCVADTVDPACVDNDGDGYGANCQSGDDCDDASASHWRDCLTCTDGDGDGFGSACDLGADCDDTDDAIHAGCGGFAFGAPTYSVAEDAGALTVTVSRSSGVGAESVGYATRALDPPGAPSGHAVAGSDFVPATSVLSFGEGETSQSFSITIIDDAEYTGNLAFEIILADAASGELLAPPEATLVTILENESPSIPSPGTIRLTASTFTAMESEATFTVTLIREEGVNGAVSVAYATEPLSAADGVDYTATSGRATWADGVGGSQVVEVPLFNNGIEDGTRTFRFQLSDPQNADVPGDPPTLTSPALATCSILDDESLSSLFEAGITTSFDKVFFEAPTEFDGEVTAVAEIALARNEYEATQLVITPAGDLSNVTVAVTDLTRVGGSEQIPASDIEVNVVGYVNLVEAKVVGSRTGWHPDPLLPNQALDLTAGVLQPYLITVRTVETTVAGQYEGSIDISVDGAPAQSILFRVEVWNFALPHVAHMKTTNFGSWGFANTAWPGNSFTDEERRAHILALADLGFRNRLPPTIFLANGLVSWNWGGDGDTFYGYPTHDGETFNATRTNELIDYMLAKGANHFFLGITSDIFLYPDYTDGRRQRLLKYLNDYRQHLLGRGLLDMTYVYNVDEPWGEGMQHAKDTYTLIKAQVGTDITMMQNSNINNDIMLGEFRGFFDAFDINLGFYDINNAATYRATYPDEFTDFWWNVNIWPDVHPNLFVEYPLIDARIIGPLSYRYDMQGFEYWDILATWSINNYHPIRTDELRVNWDVPSDSLDGTLVYPSETLEIFSSMRYESFRDGMEDNEYLHLLEQIDPTNPLLQVPVITGLSSFTQDQDVYLDFRRQVAEILSAAGI